MRTFRQVLPRLSKWGAIGLAGLLAVSCAIQDPPALVEIGKARKALDDAKKAGAIERNPAKVDELERRYLQARGTFYACNDAQALQQARDIAAEAAALVGAPPRALAGQLVARLTVQPQGRIGEGIRMDASASSSPSNDPLTYTWDFGDGTPPAKLTFPVTTHPYSRPGTYTVRVTVEDGKGGAASAAAPVEIGGALSLSDAGGALFAFGSAALTPAGKRQLAPLVQQLRANPNQRAHIIGHTDSVGSDRGNLTLSQRRAQSVLNYLVSQGVRRQNLTAEGRGKRELKVPEPPLRNPQNRRVEIVLK